LNLRRALLLIAALALVAALLLVANRVAPAWWLLVQSAILLAALLFERHGYQPQAPDPSALKATGERFQDPTTGQTIEVWEDPATGAREYRPLAGRR
jgi:hypothetical protein